VGQAVSVGVGMGNAILGIWGFWVGLFGFGGRTSKKTVSASFTLSTRDDDHRNWGFIRLVDLPQTILSHER
jgi:hypothetical protein